MRRLRQTIRKLFGRKREHIRFVCTLLAMAGLLTCAAPPSTSSGLTSAQTIAPNWRYTGSLNTVRHGYTATLLPNGQVLVAGGFSSDYSSINNTAELYDPANGKWSLTGSLIAPRVYHSAILLRNGKVLVAGGYSASCCPDSAITPTAELYDPVTGTWSLTGNLNVPNIGRTLTLLSSGKVLSAGGAPNIAELYDPLNGTWSFTGHLNDARVGHTATVLQDGRVLVAGGVGDQDCEFAEICLNSAELYDPNTGAWSYTGSLKDPQYGAVAITLQTGNVLVAGGSDPFATTSAQLYDPATGQWGFTGSLLTSRFDAAGTLLPSGQVLLAGGQGTEANDGSHYHILNSAELYDPATGTWHATANLNTARLGHTATLLRNGQVLVVGGIESATSPLQSAELYDSGVIFNPNPIDDPQFFARQHYRDFLGREPDAPGLAHWTNEITMCSDVVNRLSGETEAQCIDRKRVNTSGAFYLSNEFQNSANFLIRVNWGSLGKDRAIGTTCIIGQYSALDAVCRPLYSDYIADLAKLTKGIVVNDALDPNVINTNKHNFVSEFVTRPDFLAGYPNSMTADEYVDKLIQTTGVAVTAQERADLIAKSGTHGRGAVLYDLVDGTTSIADGFLRFDTRYGKAYYDQVFNPAFVFVEYLAYLRRNPDQEGFDHWLGKLNFYGNFVDAEMVRSFIISDEYRKRFGTK